MNFLPTSSYKTPNIMKISELNNALTSTIERNWGLLISLVVVLVSVLVRVISHKYSFDTTGIFIAFHNILFDNIMFFSKFGGNYFNTHFSPILILMSPLYFLGPTILIFSWKFLCYGGFLIILWRLIDSENRYDITNWHKNLFLLLVTLHPSFVANLISPNVWDSDLILPLLGLSVLYISRNRYFWSVFWLCLTFLVKEDMMLVGILYGLFLAFHTKNANFIWLSCFSLGWFWLTTHIVMPYFASSEAGLHLLKFSFGNLGNSMGEIIVNSIMNPHLLISNGLWMRKFASLFIILACVGFLPFWKKRSLIYLLPGVSVLTYTIIAVQPYLDYSKHYILVFFVFIAWSSYESYIVINKGYRAKVALFSIVLSIIVIVVLQINIRVWSFYLSPVENYHTLISVKKEFIPPKSYMITGGLSSPWTCYKNNCVLPLDWSPHEIEKKNPDYILINLRTIFWEILSCTDETLAINLMKLNKNEKYRVLYYSNDIVLLKRNPQAVDFKQPDWSGRLEKYQKINHDCMKSDLMKRLRLF